MQRSRQRFLFATFALLATSFAAQPATARRAVYDSWGFFEADGYCSPSTSFDYGCPSYTMPFSVNIGGKSYNSFYVNSNGTLSFGSIESFLTKENSPLGSMIYTGPPPITNLAAYGVPIFSPIFSDGPGYYDEFNRGGWGGYDGNFISQVSMGTNSITASWTPCDGFSLDCGFFSGALVAGATYNPSDWTPYDLQWVIMSDGCFPCTPEQQFATGKQNLYNYIMNDEPIFTMTLTDLANGFRVDYSYNAGAMGGTGIYGFSLPSGTNQITGPLEDQSYFFNTVGHWRRRGPSMNALSQFVAVPEPATWTSLLVGFAMLGMGIRRKRRLRAA